MSATLLMIHGIGCDARAFDVMKPLFEKGGWRCEAISLFPDRRVAKNPPANLADLGFEDYVRAVSEEAARLTARDGVRPAVIGHSMGGLIAQQLAVQGDVSQAIFLTPAQSKDCAVIGPSVAWTFANILLSQNRRKGHKIWKTGFVYGVLNRTPREKHDAIFAAALYDSGRVYGEMTDGISIDETKVRIPTLTIAATHDRATLASAVRKVGAKFAKSPVPGNFVEYPDNAHWIVDEPGTDKVVADCLAWLARTRIHLAA